MAEEILKIPEMDCDAECELLRKILKNKEGIEDLNFDLIKKEVAISYTPAEITPAEIIHLIQRGGMNAYRRAHPLSFWSKERRTLLCLASGICLTFGFILHLIGPEEFFKTGGFDLRFSFPPLPVSLLYCVSIVVGGYYVAPKAIASLRHFHLDMNVLMMVAVLGAIAIGQLFEGAMVTFLFSVALLLENWSIERARKAMETLLDLSPKKARVLTDKGCVEQKIEEIKLGSSIAIYPQERVPLDGTVTSGSSSVNQAPITGESLPVFKEKGSSVFAGTINEGGTLEVEVTKRANDTQLAHITSLVQEARSKKGKKEKWVDRFSQVYTPIMIGLAFFTSLIPPLFFGGDWIDWIYRGLVLLVIACPCALVISTPVAIVSGLTYATKNGVLIKGGVFLEQIAHLKAIAFDKTGTVTFGRPTVENIIPLNGHTEEDLLAIAAGLETQSLHPLARAILEKATEKGIKAKKATDFQPFKGLGAEASLEGKSFWIGSHRFMHEKKRKEDAEAHKKAIALEDGGHSVVAIGDFSHICGLISLSDKPRPHLNQIFAEIDSLKIEKILMLTGDNEKTARALAQEVGLSDYKAELLPEDKLICIEQLKKEYGISAMVGDGVNDAPAMAASDIGIAMGAIGNDVAFETSDIALMEDDLSKIPFLIAHARRTLRVIQHNIAFSLFVKGLFIALAFLGLSTLWMAIAADTGATLLVVFNSLRLTRS